MEITITCLANLAIMCSKSQQNLEILLKSLKFWKRFSSVSDPGPCDLQTLSESVILTEAVN